MATVLLLPILPWERAAVVLPAASPFVTIAAVLVTWTAQATFGIGLLVGLIASVRKRWFCRWVCPTGLCADGASRVGLLAGRRCPRLPALGLWLALLTWGGACVGYPLLLWLDPLAMFAGLFRLTGSTWEISTWCCASGVPAVLIVSLLWPTSWCARLCPLGATQDLLAEFSRFGSALRPKRSSAPAAEAIVPSRHRAGFPRRTVLGLCLGAAWASAVQAVRGAPPAPLRPPGAQEELSFVGLCVRCGNCIRSCPTKIIRPDDFERGLTGWLAPLVEFRDNYCLEGCTRCLDVCPSGALRPLSLAEKIQAPLGVPQVDMNICLLSDDRECSVCRNRCPFEAIQLIFSEADYTLRPQVDLKKCPGCGACEVACPTQPKKAIVVRPKS